MENCLRGPTGVARLQALLGRAGLSDFRVRPATGAREADCFVDVDKPEPFDGRTIELLTEATVGTGVQARPAPTARERRRRCERVFAEAASRAPGAKGQRLTPSTVGSDPRLRQAQIELTECP